MTIQADVTARIIAELEKGAAPWVKPWKDAGADCNAFSLKPYRGINRLLLAMSMRQSNKWATYKQWAAAGGQVRKGEKGTPIVFYKALAIEEERDGETVSRNIPMLRQFVVFNAEQVDGIKFEPVTPPAEHERLAGCEATIARTGAVITHGGGVACYVPSADVIRIPNMGDFTGREQYYATVFHELSHWTGAKHRLNREIANKFASPRYAFEELVAELSAAMLCAHHQVTGELRHAGYIGHWLECLRENDRAILKAAALAEKAFGFIADCAEAEEAEAA